MKFLQLIRMIKFNTSLSRTYCQLKGAIQLENANKYKNKRLEYDDKIFSQAMMNVKSEKARLKSGLIALEGKRLIQDALKIGVQPKMIFYTKKNDVEELTHLNKDVSLYKMPYKDMQLWSDLTTCPGIIAFCRKPEQIAYKSETSLPVTVVCDQVREPGNLGAIIRCAAAAGIQKVLLTKGCVDVWSSKVLRGAAGAHFHLPVYSDIIWENFTKQINKNTEFLLAVNQPSSVETSLHCLPYYKMEYSRSKDIVVVVGGETEGLSETVFSLAKEINGKAINIPLSNDVESLNCVTAVGILLFEIKRQLSL